MFIYFPNFISAIIKHQLSSLQKQKINRKSSSLIFFMKLPLSFLNTLPHDLLVFGFSVVGLNVLKPKFYKLILSQKPIFIFRLNLNIIIKILIIQYGKFRLFKK